MMSKYLFYFIFLKIFFLIIMLLKKKKNPYAEWAQRMVTYMSPPCIYLQAIAFFSHPLSLLPHLCGLKNLSFPLGSAAGWQLNLTLLSSFSNLDISIQHSVLRFSDLDPSDHSEFYTSLILSSVNFMTFSFPSIFKLKKLIIVSCIFNSIISFTF